jgi:hypothetical protein
MGWVRILVPDGLGFLDQHDGDIVANLVTQSAVVTDQTVLTLVQINITFALGADQNVQQVLGNGHATSSSPPAPRHGTGYLSLESFKMKYRYLQPTHHCRCLFPYFMVKCNLSGKGRIKIVLCPDRLRRKVF